MQDTEAPPAPPETAPAADVNRRVIPSTTEEQEEAALRAAAEREWSAKPHTYFLAIVGELLRDNIRVGGQCFPRRTMRPVDNGDGYLVLGDSRVGDFVPMTEESRARCLRAIENMRVRWNAARTRCDVVSTKMAGYYKIGDEKPLTDYLIFVDAHSISAMDVASGGVGLKTLSQMVEAAVAK